MSKNKYVLLGVTGLAAISMIGANASMGIIKAPKLTINAPVQNQAAVVSSDNPKGEFPSVALSKSVKGAEVVAALGDKLPEVARWYRISEEELKGMAKDNSLHADRKGRLFYVDEEVIAAGDVASINTGNLHVGGVLPLEETFLLHSKPGSTKTLYLDFNGHYFGAGKSAWISTEFNAPGFDMDGNPGNFSDGERQVIQETWLRIAEDFAPYDVDVTTQEPTADKLERTSTSDNTYGNRVLYTQSGSVLRPGAGGSSYIGVFDDVGEYYKVALAFPEMLAYSAKYMADAGTHEAGHSLGLAHDGTSAVAYYEGHANWAPIMGVTYYRPIGQWSKGEYSGANNTQDDLQVMQTYGLSYRADDYGNTISSAGNARVVGNSIEGEGIIERTGDIDYLKFNSGAGNVSIMVNGGYPSPNLDAKVTLYDGSGQTLASQDLAGLETSVSASVPGGTYYIAITGVGSGSASTGYTNYGSLGQYYVTGSIVGTNNNPPVAVASAVPSSGGAPLTVQFSSNGSFDPDGGSLTYLWNFGEFATSTSGEANPVHTYQNGGNYTATLTVTDANNLSASQSVQISAVNQAPVASFTTSYSSTNIPMTVYFDASASSDPDGFIKSYAWDFGDGTTATGVTASHVYTTAGAYVAKLTVVDSGDLAGTKSVSLTAVDPNVVAAPSSLTAASTGKVKNQVILKWTDRSTNETEFVIERAVKSTNPTYQVIGKVNANIPTYTDSVPAQTYYYRVRAYNAPNAKYSAYSNVAQVRVK